MEFINLEALAPVLHQCQRSAFFTTVKPMTMMSGIASPPNVIAIV